MHASSSFSATLLSLFSAIFASINMNEEKWAGLLFAFAMSLLFWIGLISLIW